MGEAATSRIVSPELLNAFIGTTSMDASGEVDATKARLAASEATQKEVTHAHHERVLGSGFLVGLQSTYPCLSNAQENSCEKVGQMRTETPTYFPYETSTKRCAERC